MPSASDHEGPDGRSAAMALSIETEDAPEPAEPEHFPEGGWQAWGTVIGAALAQFVTFGYTNAFGVYQGKYLTSSTPSAIGWIGSIQVFLVFSSGILTGRAFDRGYFHHMMIGGSILYAISFFALSMSREDQYYQVFLSHGLGGGLACGLIYTPSMTIPSHFFLRKRAFAMGIVASGAALGATVHPIILNALFDGSVGFHNGVKVSLAMNAVLLLISLVITKTRLPPKETGHLLPLIEFLSDPSYACVFVAAMLFTSATFFPIFNIQINAIEHGVDRKLAFYIIPVLNAASFFGRFLLPIFVPRFGVFNLMIFSTSVMTITLWSHLAATTFGDFITIAIFFGFFSGAGISLRAPIATSYAKDSSEYGVRIGIQFFGAGFAGLLANPIYGALITRKFYWWRAVVFTGVAMIASTILFSAGRYLVSRKTRTGIL